LGKRLRAAGLWIATPVTSPHAFATIASLMANLGRPIAADPEKPFAFDRHAMAAALDALDAVLAVSPPETLDWNAISLSEAMAARDDIVFTPSIYGYATYAEADMRAAALLELPRPCFAVFRGLNAGRDRACRVGRDEAQGGGDRVHAVLSLRAGAGAHHSRTPWAAGACQRMGERAERRTFRQILLGRARVDRDGVGSTAEMALHPLSGRGWPTRGGLLQTFAGPTLHN
jgi:hypothetical protein